MSEMNVWALCWAGAFFIFGVELAMIMTADVADFRTFEGLVFFMFLGYMGLSGFLVGWATTQEFKDDDEEDDEYE